jgi:hypothetical protein
MRVPRIRRRWVVAAVILIVLVVTFRLLYQPVALQSYRILDPQTLVVTGYGARTARTNLSDIAETDSSVTIRVDAFTFELGPGTAEGYRLDVDVPLSAPLADRTVIDGSTGQEIPEAPPP